ncbi:MAG: nitrogenase component 1 [Schwartzia sp. (in: firmicutes)]
MGIEAKRVMKRRNACSCSMPGVWRAVSYVEGAVVIFHSPRACAHVARRMDINSYYRNLTTALGECQLKTTPLLSTDLEEDEAVFGGENRLRRTIRYAVETYHPRAIFIANSCVSGVIGDDTEAVAAEMEEETGLPVMAVTAHGFLDGEYFKGYIDAARLLAERFMKPQPKAPGTVMLVGDCGGIYGEYVQTLSKLLTHFSLRVTAHFPSFLSLEALEKASSASLIIVLGRRAEDARQKMLIELAEDIGRRFDMPVFGDLYPIGFQKTLAWLRRLGEVTGNREAADRAITAEEAAFEAAIAAGRTHLAGTKTVFCAGRMAQYFQPEELFFLLDKLGVELLGVQLFDCYNEAERKKISREVRRLTAAPLLSEEAFEHAVKAADYVLTTHELLRPDVRQVYLPFLSGAGWKGEGDILRAMVRIRHRQLSRGGLIYA